VITVTTPLADRETVEMLAGAVVSVSATEMFAAGKFDVFVSVAVNVTWAGVAATELGPAIVNVTVGRFAADGVTAFEGADSALFPVTFVACTVKV
jgi:hypothetical protein